MEEQTTPTNPSPPGNLYPQHLQINLPNSHTILVLGILALVFCWWHIISIVGIILSIVTLYLAKKELSIYYSQPGNYTLSSLNNVKAGRVCAIIGLIISIIIFVVALLTIIGFIAMMPMWGMSE
jgi:small-conductance mechanosensitive channel